VATLGNHPSGGQKWALTGAFQPVTAVSMGNGQIPRIHSHV